MTLNTFGDGFNVVLLTDEVHWTQALW